MKIILGLLEILKTKYTIKWLESPLREEGVGQLDVGRVLAAGRAGVVSGHDAPLGDLDTHGAVRAPGGGANQCQPIRGQGSVTRDQSEARDWVKTTTDQPLP